MSVRYTGVFLDKEARDELAAKFSNLYFSLLMQSGFVYETAAGDFLPSHMTMNLGKLKDPNLAGKRVALVIDAWALDEKVLAVRVRDHAGVYCDNKTPHITVFINPKKNGKPKDSNNLTNWIPLKPYLGLLGTVKEF